MLPLAKKVGLTDEVLHLRKFIAEKSEAVPIGFEELAKRAGLQDLYNGLYRALSHFAAHPSVSAASVHFVESTDGGGYAALQFAGDSTPQALSAACASILIACSLYERIDTSEAINSGIAKCLELQVQIEEKYRPWSD